MKRARGAHAAALLVRPARGAQALAGRVPGAQALAGRVPGAQALAGRVPGAQALAGLAWRERGPRARIALLAGLAVAVLLGAGAGAVLAGTGHPPHTTGAPGTAAVPGSATRAARWLAGPAGKLLSAVNADLGRAHRGRAVAAVGPGQAGRPAADRGRKGGPAWPGAAGRGAAVPGGADRTCAGRPQRRGRPAPGRGCQPAGWREHDHQGDRDGKFPGHGGTPRQPGTGAGRAVSPLLQLDLGRSAQVLFPHAMASMGPSARGIAAPQVGSFASENPLPKKTGW